MDSLKTFNAAALEELVELERDGSPGLIKDLIQDFVAQHTVYLKSMAESARAVDFLTLERAAHSLKSSSKIMGLEKTAHLCERIEIGARAISFDDQTYLDLKIEIQKGISQLIAFKV
jgi:HPt (histidine-containing phosphotransfer) domain-containing protein